MRGKVIRVTDDTGAEHDFTYVSFDSIANGVWIETVDTWNRSTTAYESGVRSMMLLRDGDYEMIDEDESMFHEMGDSDE